MNYNAYALRNDSARPVYLHLCADTACAKLDGHFDWMRVDPGRADTEQIY